MHVALGCREIFVSRQFLNRLRSRPVGEDEIDALLN